MEQQPKKKRASGRRKTKAEKLAELTGELVVIINGDRTNSCSPELKSSVEADIASRNESKPAGNEIISLTPNELKNEKIRAIAEAYLKTREGLEPVVMTDENTDEKVYGRKITMKECREMIESDKKEDLNIRISEFVISMNGKPRATNAEITVMYELYFELTGVMERDKTCSVCVMRCYKRLKAESEKTK